MASAHLLLENGIGLAQVACHTIEYPCQNLYFPLSLELRGHGEITRLHGLHGAGEIADGLVNPMTEQPRDHADQERHHDGDKRADNQVPRIRAVQFLLRERQYDPAQQLRLRFLNPPRSRR